MRGAGVVLVKFSPRVVACCDIYIYIHCLLVHLFILFLFFFIHFISISFYLLVNSCLIL